MTTGRWTREAVAAIAAGGTSTLPLAATVLPDPAGPAGLYGMMVDGMRGPRRPMNGTGLVPANPETAPYQTYSRLVQDDLSVLSCIDMSDLDTLPTDTAVARAYFGGIPT